MLRLSIAILAPANAPRPLPAAVPEACEFRFWGTYGNDSKLLKDTLCFTGPKSNEDQSPVANSPPNMHSGGKYHAIGGIRGNCETAPHR
jgi:hypothetical protein